MDDLLHFVRHEVAMDGDDGTPIERLDSFLQTFYARTTDQNGSATSSSSSTIKSQNIDDSFKDFVWKQLASLPELKVAFLRKLDDDTLAGTPDPGTGPSTPALPLPSEDNTAGDTSTLAPVASGSNTLLDDDGNPVDQGAFNLKNKAKIKAARKDDVTRHRDARLTGDQYEFVEIAQDEIQNFTREALLEKYGSTLRIAADPETCYVAITGSPERFSKLTPLVYQVLQAIARGRENGKTVVDLGKEFAHDQKSLFHFVKSLCELNLIIKMKVLDSRSQTSRCIHRHYLETSRHWATWTAKDPNEGTTKGEDEEDDMGKSAPLTMMTVAHVHSNEPFVRSRIINALKNAPDQLIPHVDLVFAIGLHARPGREARRRINRIVSTMERLGLVEKVGVARQGAKGLLSCLKLSQTPQIEGEGSEAQEVIQSEEDEIEQRPNILLTLPVERQVIDLLVSAGHQGLTIRELQAGLGDVGIRSLETLLMRIEKNLEPTHLCDYRIQSVFETHGREKRLRYFTTSGYHERCKQDGLIELVNKSDFTNPDLAGGFSIVDKSEFYTTPKEFTRIAEKMQTNATGKPTRKPKTTTGKTKSKTPKDPNQAPAKKGRPKKVPDTTTATTATDGDGVAATTTLPDETTVAEKPKKVKQKKVKVEGEEQADKKKGRPKKVQPEGEGGQSQLEPTAESATPVVNGEGESFAEGGEIQPTKKKYKPRKSKVIPDEVPAVPAEGSLATTEPTGTGEGDVLPLAEGGSETLPDQPPKKKYKPRKSEVVAETVPVIPVEGSVAPVEGAATEEGEVQPLPEGVSERPAEQPPKKTYKPRKSKVVANAAPAVLVEESVAPLEGTLTEEGDQIMADQNTLALDPHLAGDGSHVDSPQAGAEVNGAVTTATLPQQPKKRPRVSQVHEGTPSENGTDKSSKKYRAELDANGMPIKGRPRKYPPGTTSQQRRVLLEQRRKAGLEPPSKKQKRKSNAVDGETGSVPPSTGTPASEPGNTTTERQDSQQPQQDLTHANLNILQDTRPDMENAEEGSVLAASSLEPATSVPDTSLQALPPLPPAYTQAALAPEVTETFGNTATVPEVTDAVSSAYETSASTVPQSTSAPIVSRTNPDAIEPSASSASLETKKRGRPRKNPLPEAVTVVESVASADNQHQDKAGSPPAMQDTNAADVSIDNRQRRSKRQKTEGAAPSAPIARPRRGRSSKGGPADTVVKVEEMPLPIMDADMQTTALQDEHQTAIIAEERWVEEAPNRGTIASETMPIDEVTVHNMESEPPAGAAVSEVTPAVDVSTTSAGSPHLPEQRHAGPTEMTASEKPRSGKKGRQPRKPVEQAEETPSTTEAAPKLPDFASPPEAIADGPVSGVETEAAVQDGVQVADMDVLNTNLESHQSQSEEMPDMQEDARTTIEVPVQSEQTPEIVDAPRQLPAMPEPLPGSGSILTEAGPVDIAPNVVGKPADINVQQDKDLAGPERRNHSMQVHENEYIATLNDAGGIAEEGIPLNKLWQEYMQRKDPSKGLPRPLDRRTMKGVSTSLEKRGLVKRSILQFQNSNGKMVQRQIMYLSNITLGSPQMREFAISMQEKMDGMLAGSKNWLSGRKTIDKTSEMAVAPRRGRRPVGEIPTDPRPFFLKNWRIVAQYFGWHYGFLARARTLHEFLVSSITDDNDSSFIISSTPTIRIFSAPFVLLDTPLSIFIRIAAVSEYSEDLEEFMKQDESRNIAINKLRTELSGLFGTKRARGYSRFSQLFETLMMLKLLVPLEQVDYETPIVAYSGAEREARYFAAKDNRAGATYWLLPSHAPLYDMQERKASEQRLLGQLPVFTLEQASHYWNTVQALTFGEANPADLPAATVKYPPTMNAPRSFINSARSSWHWRSRYLLLSTQKTYLRRILDEAPSKDMLLSDHNKLIQLAYNICAPVDAVEAYYAKPQQGARPEWAKKRKRRISRKQILDDSGTSGSEADGPKAPMARSQLTDQAKAERARKDRASKEAAKFRKQQEIISKKAQGASEAKQSLWDGIINGFRLQHGEDVLKTVQLDFLHTWFMSPEGPTGTTIQKHLEQAVEGVRSAPIVIPSRSMLAGKKGSIAHRGQGTQMQTKSHSTNFQDYVGTGIVNGFALSDLPELPEVIPTDEKKSAKAGWSAEEDEQLIDLYIILQSRANDKAAAFSMEPATALFGDVKPTVLVHRLRRLASKPGEIAYLDALQAAWSELWHKKQITDPLLHEAVRNASPDGLLLLRRVLNGLLNKQSLRFQAIMPADAAAASQTRLPANPEDLRKSYIVESKNALEKSENSQTYSYLWSMTTTAQKSAKFNYQPFCTSYENSNSAEPLSSEGRLRVFKTRYERLDKISSDCLKDANAFTKRLLDEGEVEWAPICEDGDMLAVTHLFSDDLLKFTVDTSVTRPGRPYTDYRTRKIDDDGLENSLIIQPNERFGERRTPLFNVPSESNDGKASKKQNSPDNV